MPPMTFSHFTPGDTRSLAAKMAEQERAAQVKVSNRQFLISVGVVMLALALFAVFLLLL
jgi:hypothetical protein